MQREKKSISKKKKKIYIRRTILGLIVFIILITIKIGIGSITYSGRHRQMMQELQQEASKSYSGQKAASATEEYKGVIIRYIYPEHKDPEVENMVINQMKSRAYETIDNFKEEKSDRSLALVYRGSNITDRIISFSIEQNIYIKNGSDFVLDSQIKEPQMIVDGKTGGSFSLEDIFRSDVDPIPTINQRIKEAIIETKKMDINNISQIGGWKYPDSIVGSGIKLSDKGLYIPIDAPNGEVDNVIIPLNKLISIIKPEFLCEEINDKRKEIIKKREEGIKQVALTFNYGSGEEASKLLDMLKKEKIKATIYINGEIVGKNKNILKRVVDDGSEIGNLSWSNKNMTDLKEKQIYQEVLKTQYEIFNVTGEFPRTFRPPYAAIDANSADKINMPIVIWALDSQDWNDKSAQQIYNRTVKNVKTGDIVLFNKMDKTSTEAAKKIIEKLKKEKYEFMTVSELMNENIYPGNAYHSIGSIRNLESEEKEIK